MACACLGCTNKRSYYLWLKDTVEESGMKVPGSLQFDPFAVSNTRLDSAINRMLKLYRLAIRIKYDEPAVQSSLPFDSWEIKPWDFNGLKKKFTLNS